MGMYKCVGNADSFNEITVSAKTPFDATQELYKYDLNPGFYKLLDLEDDMCVVAWVEITPDNYQDRNIFWEYSADFRYPEWE